MRNTPSSSALKSRIDHLRRAVLSGGLVISTLGVLVNLHPLVPHRTDEKPLERNRPMNKETTMKEATKLVVAKGRSAYWICTTLFVLQIGFTAYAQLRIPDVAL